MKSSAPTKRILYLDSLRGFAAIWVAMTHIGFMPNPPFSFSSWLFPYVKYGTMGVELFFVLSALSLCLSMKVHDNESKPMLGFFLRRFFRIAPLFYALIVFTYFFNFPGFTYTWKSVLTNMLFIFNFFPGHSLQSSLTFGGWSIGVEVIFYALFPFIFSKVKNLRHAVILLFATILICNLILSILPMYIRDMATYSSYTVFSRLPIFCFGIIAYFLIPLTENIENKKEIGSILLLSSVIIFGAVVSNLTPFVSGYYWIGAMFLLLVVGFHLNPVNFICNEYTAWLGKISFSIYLVHPAVIAAYIPLFKRIQDYALPSSLIYSICFSITMATVIPISALIYYFLEDPINNFGRKVSKSLAK